MHVPLNSSFENLVIDLCNWVNWFECRTIYFLIFMRNSPHWARVSSFTRFLDHTRRTTFGRTPLDEWSARRRDLYPTIHNTHNRQTSMPPVGFETTISAGERRQTYALDRVATGTGVERWDFRYHKRREFLCQMFSVWFVPSKWRKQQIFSVNCTGTQNGTLTYHLPWLCN